MKKLIIHFLDGSDVDIEDHYRQKDYRLDIIVEFDGLYYEVYFFLESVLWYEMRADGFFSFPGIIFLDEISNAKIINSLKVLVGMGFLKNFRGHESMPVSNRFVDVWYMFGDKMHSIEKLSSIVLVIE